MAFRTQEEVDRLRPPAGKSDHWEFDSGCTGLSIRFQGKRRTWVAWYTPPGGGKRRKVSLGDVASVRLQKARDDATEIVLASRKGQDVGAERKAAKAAARAKAADILGRLISIYLERKAKPEQKPRSYAETERNLSKAWAPLHDRPVDSITRRDIAEQLERIRTTSGPTAAKNARVYLSGCFAWAMRQGFAEHNPTIGTEAPAAPPSRARALSEAELVEVWNAAGEDDFGRLVRLLALLGQRRDEVANMAWSEVDVERKLWVLPSGRVKNRREHEIGMPEQAIALLPQRRPGRDLVFGRGEGGFSGFSNCKERLDKRILEARRKADPEVQPMAPWRLHDLRHSWSTHAHEIGIEPHIVEACLNHVSGYRGGIAGRYNHSALRSQKRAAMQRYADWLMGLVSGEQPSNVVAFA
jgi:integrase